MGGSDRVFLVGRSRVVVYIDLRRQADLSQSDSGGPSTRFSQRPFQSLGPNGVRDPSPGQPPPFRLG